MLAGLPHDPVLTAAARCRRSRVQVHNPTSQPLTVDPEPSAGLVPLNSTPDQVAPGATADHDYVVAADRFGGTYAWPDAARLAAAGGYSAHFAHMRHQLPEAAVRLARAAGRERAAEYRDGSACRSPRGRAARRGESTVTVTLAHPPAA